MSLKAIDTSFLLYLISSSPQAPKGHNLDYFSEQIAELKQKLVEDGKVIIPTPVLAEIASHYPDGELNLEAFSRFKSFIIMPFDQRAALRLGEINRRAKESGIFHTPERGRQDVKIDRQILAISLAAGVRHFYTADKRLGEIAEQEGMNVVYPWTLPLPSHVRLQQDLPFDASQVENNIIPLKKPK